MVPVFLFFTGNSDIVGNANELRVHMWSGWYPVCVLCLDRVSSTSFFLSSLSPLHSIQMVKGVRACVKDIPASKFINALAAQLKASGKINVPEYAEYVKTSQANEMPPQNPDWFYVRTASVARRVYLRGGNGVSTMAKMYGGAKKFGVRRKHFQSASQGIIRAALKQLVNLKIVSTKPNAPYVFYLISCNHSSEGSYQSLLLRHGKP